FHLLAFVPRGVAATVFLVMLASMAAAWRGFDRRAPIIDTVTRKLAQPLFAAVFTGVATALFWIFRSHQTVLGDAWPLATDLPHGVEFHPRQPLAMMVQQAVYDAQNGGQRLTFPGAPTMADPAVHRAILSAQCVSVACGALFVALACAL